MNLKSTQGYMRNNTVRRAGTRTSEMFTKLNKSNTSRNETIYTYDVVKLI